MVALASKRLTKTRRKPGRRPELSGEDQVLLTLQYWRECRTLLRLATSRGLRESNVCRVTRRAEDILTESRALKLPGKEALQPAGRESVAPGVAETPVRRPRKSSKPTTAAKRSATR